MSIRKLLEAKKRGHFDASVLGVSHRDLDAMDADEEQDEMVDSINRAADLCQAVIGAFPKLDRNEKAVLHKAAQELIKLARSY